MSLGYKLYSNDGTSKEVDYAGILLSEILDL